jgi:hypothetical protein
VEMSECGSAILLLWQIDIFDVPPPQEPVEGGGSVKGGKRNS